MRLRHPIWSAGTAARRLGAMPAVARLRNAARHLVRRSHPVRLIAPARQWTDHDDASQALRWIGPVALRHATREALFCQPNSGIEYHLTAMPGSRFVADVGISPDAWAHHPPAVRFRIEMRSVSGKWTRSAERTIDAGSRVTHRGWHTLRVEVPAEVDGYGEDVVVTLSTHLASRASAASEPRERSAPAKRPARDRVGESEGRRPSDPGCAWALFGEPRLERSRPAREVRQSLATFVARARENGVRDALRLAQDAAASQDAEQYATWCALVTPGSGELEAMTRAAAALPFQPRFSIVTPVYNTDPRWLRPCIESVRRQAYPHWQLVLADDASTSAETIAVLREYVRDPRITVVRLERNSHISAATNAGLAKATGEFVAFLDHDDELTPDALFEVARHLNAHPDADLMYSDEDKLDLAGARCDPYFKPDWSPEHFLTCMYTCHLMVVRRALLEEIGGFRVGYEGAQDYDLVLRLMERTRRIDHIPRILYHWRKLETSTASAGAAKPWAMDAGRLSLEDYVKRNRLAAEVLPGPAAGVFRIKRAIAGTPLVSIVIPTAGELRRRDGQDLDLLATCIRSIADRTAWPHYEVVLVTDGTGLQPTTMAALKDVRHLVVRPELDAPFNFSRKINLGVARASGEHVVLLNDDVEVKNDEWMSAMLEWSQDPGIGAVGAKLLYPDGRLQHIGMVLGVGGIAAHAFHQHPGSSPGYASSALSIRNYSAVTAACLMSRRAVFLEAGGFDEALPVDFNDIDYCLRLANAGYRTIFTPYAQLFHHESASVGGRVPRREDIELMRSRWGAVIDDDPFYNPNLTREAADYRLPTSGRSGSSGTRRARPFDNSGK